MKTLILVIIASLGLSSCQTVRHVDVNGEKIFEVSCNGTARTYMDCMQKASETCAQRGLKMVALEKDGHSVVVGNSYGINSGVNRSMSFKCE